MNEPTKEDYEAFLTEYKQLIEKHNIYISGCGCCSSPFLEYIRSQDQWERTLEGNIQHLRDTII